MLPSEELQPIYVGLLTSALCNVCLSQTIIYQCNVLAPKYVSESYLFFVISHMYIYYSINQIVIKLSCKIITRTWVCTNLDPYPTKDCIIAACVLMLSDCDGQISLLVQSSSLMITYPTGSVLFQWSYTRLANSLRAWARAKRLVEVMMTLYRGWQAKLYFFVLISRTINHLSMVYGVLPKLQAVHITLMCYADHLQSFQSLD